MVIPAPANPRSAARQNRQDSGRRAGDPLLWVWLGGIAALLTLLVTGRLIWQQDLPEWLYSGAQFWRVLLHLTPPGVYTLVHYPVPNAVFQFGFGLVAWLAGARTAGGLYVLLLIPAAIALALRAAPNDPAPVVRLRAVAIVGIVFLGRTFWLGNADFLIGCLLVAGALACRANRPRAWLAPAFLLAGFFTHAIALLALAPLWCEAALTRPSLRRATMLGVMGALILCVWYIAAARHSGMAPDEDSWFRQSNPTLTAVLKNKVASLAQVGAIPILAMNHTDQPVYRRLLQDVAPSLAAWALLAGGLLARWREPRLRWVAGGLFAMGLILPSNLLGVYEFDYRVLLLAALVVLWSAELPRLWLCLNAAMQLGALGCYVVFAISVHGLAATPPTPAQVAARDFAQEVPPAGVPKMAHHPSLVPATVVWPTTRHAYYWALDKGVTLPLSFGSGLIANAK